jgi:hypothetical protein
MYRFMCVLEDVTVGYELSNIYLNVRARFRISCVSL